VWEYLSSVLRPNTTASTPTGSKSGLSTELGESLKEAMM
jgi:hypothetical protein